MNSDIDTLAPSADDDFALADHLPILCWVAYADGYIFRYNKRWYDYTGTTPESQEGWGWESFHDPRYLPLVLERWKHALSTGTMFEMTFPLKGADGLYSPIFDARCSEARRARQDLSLVRYERRYLRTDRCRRSTARRRGAIPLIRYGHAEPCLDLGGRMDLWTGSTRRFTNTRARQRESWTGMAGRVSFMPTIYRTPQIAGRLRSPAANSTKQNSDCGATMESTAGSSPARRRSKRGRRGRALDRHEYRHRRQEAHRTGVER